MQLPHREAGGDPYERLLLPVVRELEVEALGLARLQPESLLHKAREQELPLLGVQLEP